MPAMGWMNTGYLTAELEWLSQKGCYFLQSDQRSGWSTNIQALCPLSCGRHRAKGVLPNQGLNITVKWARDHGVNLLQGVRPCGTHHSVLPLRWLQTKGRMEYGEKTALKSRLFASELDPTPQGENKGHANRARGIGMSVVFICGAAAAQVWGFAQLGLWRIHFIFFSSSIYVGRSLFLRFLLGRKKKRKRCCLVIKGRTILVLASSCIVWWVLCLRNAGDVSSYYALASLKLQQ